MAAGAAEYTEVDFMVVAVVMDVVAEEDVVEGAMVKTHINFPEVMKHFCKKLVYTLHTNVESSPCNKIIILKK